MIRLVCDRVDCEEWVEDDVETHGMWAGERQVKVDLPEGWQIDKAGDYPDFVIHCPAHAA
jgi:hypothetical protein